jgi:HAD superfamily hydrolase (TIGR01490 family)
MVLEVDHVHHPKHTGKHFQKAETVKKGIAFFDFDGTISSKDSLAEMIRFMHGEWGFRKGVALTLPMILGYQLGLVDRQRSKEVLFTRFFGGLFIDSFEKSCETFHREILPGIIREGVAERLHWHREQGHELVLVSASPENWLRHWCAEQGMTCLATQLEIREGRLTGRIEGRNCQGTEKVSRIKASFNLETYEEIHAYGDTPGDRPMLSLAHHPHYKPFR